MVSDLECDPWLGGLMRCLAAVEVVGAATQGFCFKKSGACQPLDLATMKFCSIV